MITQLKKYGPINSIVLSRSGESDNVYLRDEQSVEDNGLCEIKIKDNQIMNFNDRSSYLQDILSRLDGLEYYLNDFASTGITYYDLCDKYDIQIGEQTYSCVMLNDEINITQGLEEFIRTERPEASETDYTKADKTDQRINQTYIIVDKQNQRIDSVVSKVDGQDTKISQITQTVDELNSKISDIADITISGESQFASFTLNEINESEPIMIKVRPTVTNISYLYPHKKLYPTDRYFPYKEGLKPSNSLTPSNSLVPETGYPEQDILYPKRRIIRFENLTTGEISDYELPDDLLIYDNTHYDEFYLDYDSQTCQITKRCKYNADGTVSLLDNERIDAYPYPSILLKDGDYRISILGYEYGYLFTRLMAKNMYTSQFATKVEVNSKITQTATEITSEVEEKYATKQTTNALSSRISQTAKSIVLETRDNNTSAGITIRLRNENGEQLDSKSANITMSGKVAFTDLSNSGRTTINGGNITTGTIDASRVNVTNLKANNITSGTLSADRISGGTINGENVTITNLNASNIKTGTLSAAAINLGSGTFTASTSGNISASSGKVGGWNLSSSRLYGTSSGDNVQYALRPYGIDDRTNNVSVGWAQVMRAAVSDKRLKKSIKNIDNSYEQFFDNLKPVTYYFNDSFNDNKKHIGFIAQDILENQKNIKDNLAMINRFEKESEYYLLDKQEIIALNTWQIQKLKQEIKELKQVIQKLKEEK